MIVVCWLFQGHGFDRRRVMTYGPEHVRALGSMLRRHGGHELLCITDQPEAVQAAGVAPGVAAVAMPREVAALPRYYPKLWAFSRELGDFIGERYASIDLDAVVVDDLAPVLDTGDDFLVWDQARGEPYNTSLFALEPGARSHVWERFTVELGEAAELAVGRPTGDQCWLGHLLGPGQPTFSEAAGVIQYRPSLHRADCPPGAKALFMCGPYRPDLEATESTWVKEAWR